MFATIRTVNDDPQIFVEPLGHEDVICRFVFGGTELRFTGRLREVQQFVANWDTLVTRLANEREDQERNDG